MPQIMHHAVELFVSAAPGDRALRQELCARLAPLVEGGLVREATASAGEASLPSLQSADIVVVLLSPEALAERSPLLSALDEALGMERERRAVVIPLRARPCDVSDTPLAARVIYPRDERALDDPDHQGLAFREAITGILTGVALCHVTIGDHLLEREREAAAAAAFRRAHAIAERLTSEAPDDRDHLVLLALVRDRLGDALLAAGDGPSALAAFEAARRVRERLVRTTPAEAAMRRALARCHESIGEVLRAMGQKPEALAAYLKCLELREALAEELTHPEAKRELYATHGRIGHVHRAMGNTAAALEAFRTGLSLAEALAAEDEAAQHRADTALFYFRVATVLSDGETAERKEARTLLERALVLYRDLEASAELTTAQSIWPPAVEALLDTITLDP
jgi:tetratricopeptide (TPR) repeat protein